MKPEEVHAYIARHRDLFPTDREVQIREALLALPDERAAQLKRLKLKQPSVTLMLSMFFGGIGADQFYLGRYVTGMAKALTCGFSIVGWIVFIFLAPGTTRRLNFKRIMQF